MKLKTRGKAYNSKFHSRNLPPKTVKMLLFVLLLACPNIYALGTFKLIHETQLDEADGNVLQVHVFFRNGVKQPKEFYPYDTDANDPLWSFGPNGLTINGRKQGYELGRTLRLKYYRVFPMARAWMVVRSTSSNTERNLMSSTMVLAGMLPPSYNDLWDKYTQWQPAVTYVDDLLTCEDCIQRDYNYKISEQLQQMYQRVVLKTGMKISNPSEVLKLYECLETKSQNNIYIPEWTHGIMDLIKTEAAKAFDYSHESVKIKVGTILEKLAMFNDSEITHKINLYSTHGSIIGGLLRALDVRIKEPPNFMSVVIIEFRRTKDGGRHAQFWHRLAPNYPLIRVAFENCGIRCPVRELKIILKPHFPKRVSIETTDCKQKLFDLVHFLISISFALVCLIILSLIKSWNIDVKNLIDKMLLLPLWAKILKLLTTNFIYYNVIKFLKICRRYISGNKCSNLREPRIF